MRTFLAFAALTASLLAAACDSGPQTCSGCGGDGGSGGDGGGGSSQACTPGSVQTCYSGPDGTQGVGVCKSGMRKCRDDGLGYGECIGEVVPTAETCNGPSDEDCDGLENEEGAGCVCVPATTEACYTGPDGTAGVGVCAEGTRTCDATGLAYGSCIGDVTPTAELCDGVLDEDCDGIACGEPVWGGGLGSAGADAVLAMTAGAQGDVYLVLGFSAPLDLAGQTFTPTDAEDVLVVRFDPDGFPLWASAFATAGAVTIGGIAVGPAGDVALSGSIPGGATLDVDGAPLGAALGAGFVVHLAEADGAVLASTLHQGKVFNQPIETRCGGVAWKASTAWLSCAAINGNQAYAFVRPDVANPTDLGVFDAPTVLETDAAFLSDGTTILTGRFTGALKRLGFTFCPATGGSDWFVSRLDAAGAPLWTKCFGGAGDEATPLQVEVGANDQIWIGAGYGAAFSLGGVALASDGPDAFVASLGAADGSVAWVRRLGGPGAQELAHLSATPDGGPRLCGRFNADFDEGLGLAAPDAVDGFVAELDTTGDLAWERAASGGQTTTCAFTAPGPTALTCHATGVYTTSFAFGSLGAAPVGSGDVWLARVGR